MGDNIAMGIGYFFMVAIAIYIVVVLAGILWDGYRAITITVWSCKVAKVAKGSYFFRGMVKYFFGNWRSLLFTESGSVRIHGPGGYWYEHNDWKAYKKKSERI